MWQIFGTSLVNFTVYAIITQGWKISFCSQRTLLSVKKFGFHSDFPSMQRCGCFLFDVGGHLLMSYMALKTFKSMSIKVCTSRLAFTRCPPSILKKISCGRLLTFFTKVLVFVQKRICASFSIQTSFDSSTSVISLVTLLKNALS